METAKRTGDHRETLYTIDKRGKRKWVYPQLVRGFYFRRRLAVAWVLIFFYLSMPWIEIAGKQAVLLDIANRKFTFFGTTLWATDTLLLAFFLAGLALCLFFFTALLGRVWCGWACPETVFLEFVFRPIEQLIEGGPVQRERLDRSPWTFEKIRKKAMKHAFCAAASWVLASTALAYFYGREPMIHMMSDWPWNNWFPFLVTLVLMGVMAFQFGWFREQFCTLLCPYARFQSVLMDEHSWAVGYDPLRGEPRGKLKKKKADQELGDCIDCGLCVRVCPTGIDIRNGNQLECIHCAQCIDACDSVMEKIDRPLGLIRYDAEEHLLRGVKKKVSPRAYLYLALLVVYGGGFLYVMSQYQPSEFKIVRGALDKPFHVVDENTISNHLHVRLTNKSTENVQFSFSTTAEDISLIAPQPFPVGPESIASAPLFVHFPLESLVDGRRPLTVFVQDNKSFRSSEEIVLLGPGK